MKEDGLIYDLVITNQIKYHKTNQLDILNNDNDKIENK